MSRIWDVDPSLLCTKHLAAEHRELHGVFVVITQNKKGYSQHPETLRWVGKLGALAIRHDQLVSEMLKRGWNHRTPLAEIPSGQSFTQDTFVNTVEEQLLLLKGKGCNCNV